MIKKIDFSNEEIVRDLFLLQKEAYMVEASLVNFFNIPPLKESLLDLMNTKEIFIGYFEADLLIGALSYTISDKELTICRLVVNSNHYRKGVAQQLISYLEKMSNGICVLNVSTAKDNEPAKCLYLKNGFHFVKDEEVESGFYLTFFEKNI